MPASLPRLFIDWLELTIPIPDERAADVQHGLDDFENWGTTLNARPPRGRYRNRYVIELPNPDGMQPRKRNEINVQSEGTARRGNFLKLTYSPNNAGDVGRELLTMILREVIGRDFRELFYAGNVNRADFSFDAYRVPLRDLWVRDRRGGNRKSAIVRGHNQQVETIYLGYGKNVRQLIVYDKGVQRGRPRGSTSWLRFEYRYNKGDYTLGDLYSHLGNPFDGFSVHKYRPLDAPHTPEQSRSIFDALRLRGRGDQSDCDLSRYVEEFRPWYIWLRVGTIWTQLRRRIDELILEEE